MWEKLKGFFNDPSGLRADVDHVNDNLNRSREFVINEVRQGVDNLKAELNKTMPEVIQEYEAQLAVANEKASFNAMTLTNLGDVMPDMLWFKYADGTYAFTNKAIRDGLLFDESPIGKTDEEIGKVAVIRFGDDGHNFGKYCAGSDKIVLDQGHRQRFIEYGMSGGKPLVLEVFKNVVMSADDKHIIGTVGSGRDITENVFTMFQLADCSDCSCRTDLPEILQEYLDKYLYENHTIGSSLRDFYEQHKGKTWAT